ncbi:hypothetical protein DHB64_13535 [Antarcticibacterium sp. W02-3]|nr:hypothetical protein [Antarcticibacterium sp. W02-3]
MLLLGPLVLQAQEREVDYIAESIITPHFFIAVIAGVVLAMGFQFILTALSVATGITAIGDIKEKYVKGKYHPNRKDNLHDLDHDVTRDDDDDDGMDTGTMITTGFGAWSVLTTIISLFGATALAINLALIASPVIAITLGLVIWATFFILLFYLESKVVNSLIGGLINTATSGLRASGEAVKSMFATSPETQMKHVAEDTVDKIRKDFSASFDPTVINDTIDEFFTKVDRNVPDYEKVKNDIKQIIEESDKRNERITRESDERTEKITRESDQRQEKVQKQTSSSSSPGKWMAIQQVMTRAIEQASGDEANVEDKGKVEQLKQLQNELKQAYGEGDTKEEKLEKVVAKFTPAEEEEVHGYIEKIKDILSKATPEDMDRDQIEQQIMSVVNNPKVEGRKLASKMGEIDRKTIIDVLAANTALNRQQIEKYADKVEELLQKVISQFSGAGSSVDGVMHDATNLKMKLEREVSKLLNGNGKPDIDFSRLTSYFQNKIGMGAGSGSGENALSSFKRKLSGMDRDTIVSAVTANTNIDQRDIDRVVQSYEDAKNNVLQKITEVEDEANRRVENLKRKAVIQAENTRKNAAAAAWWLVASAVLSAGAAIGGSLVALG